MAIPGMAWGVPEEKSARRPWHLRTLLATVATVFRRPGRAVSGSALHRAIQMPFTLAGFACIDYGVFQANMIAGWIVTGITLMILEMQLADDAPPGGI